MSRKTKVREILCLSHLKILNKADERSFEENAQN